MRILIIILCLCMISVVYAKKPEKPIQLIYINWNEDEADSHIINIAGTEFSVINKKKRGRSANMDNLFEITGFSEGVYQSTIQSVWNGTFDRPVKFDLIIIEDIQKSYELFPVDGYEKNFDLEYLIYPQE